MTKEAFSTNAGPVTQETIEDVMVEINSLPNGSDAQRRVAVGLNRLVIQRAAGESGIIEADF